MNIVIAEDDVLFREGLAALLSQLGHDVVAAVGDRRALEHQVLHLAETGTVIDLIITDVRMPPTHTDDGLAAALALRSALPWLPILILSQYIGDGYAIRLLTEQDRPNQGGTGYLLKDRIGRIDEFLRCAVVVADGGVVIDPKVVDSLVRKQRPPATALLTAREYNVIELLAVGRTNEQIATQLHITTTAVVKHIGNIFTKLELQPADGNRRVLTVLRYLQDNLAPPTTVDLGVSHRVAEITPMS